MQAWVSPTNSSQTSTSEPLKHKIIAEKKVLFWICFYNLNLLAVGGDHVNMHRFDAVLRIHACVADVCALWHYRLPRNNFTVYLMACATAQVCVRGIGLSTSSISNERVRARPGGDIDTGLRTNRNTRTSIPRITVWPIRSRKRDPGMRQATPVERGRGGREGFWHQYNFSSIEWILNLF